MSHKQDFSYEDDDRIPSYEESVSSQAPLHSDQKTAHRPSLQQHISQTRARRISQAITEYVEPLLLSHGLDGIPRRAFVLVPSDTLPATKLSERNLVSSQVVPVTVIRLEGDDNKAAFWQQPAAITEFSTALKSLIVADSTRPMHSLSDTPTSPIQTSLPPRPAKKTWLKKTFGQPGDDHDPTGSTGQWKIGWGSEQDGAAPQAPLAADEVSTSARLKDVSFRTETEMGLLATETVKCVWLEIEVGV